MYHLLFYFLLFAGIGINGRFDYEKNMIFDKYYFRDNNIVEEFEMIQDTKPMFSKDE